MGLLIPLLTIALIGVTFLAAFVRLWKSPPVLNINLSGLQLPDHIALTLTEPLDIRFTGLPHIPLPDHIALALTIKNEPADVEVKPVEEPIPEEILDYIAQESESHARDARKRYVRQLKVESGSWAAAYRLLQKEDNSLDY